MGKIHPQRTSFSHTSYAVSGRKHIPSGYYSLFRGENTPSGHVSPLSAKRIFQRTSFATSGRKHILSGHHSLFRDERVLPADIVRRIAAPPPLVITFRRFAAKGSFQRTLFAILPALQRPPRPFEARGSFQRTSFAASRRPPSGHLSPFRGQRVLPADIVRRIAATSS